MNEVDPVLTLTPGDATPPALPPEQTALLAAVLAAVEEHAERVL